MDTCCKASLIIFFLTQNQNISHTFTGFDSVRIESITSTDTFTSYAVTQQESFIYIQCDDKGGLLKQADAEKIPHLCFLYDWQTRSERQGPGDVCPDGDGAMLVALVVYQVIIISFMTTCSLWSHIPVHQVYTLTSEHGAGVCAAKLVFFLRVVYDTCTGTYV